MSIFKNPDLYPTPPMLAIKMLSKIKHWGKIKSILEPSAGMGDLVESIKDKCRHNNVDIAAIEIDTHCADMLRGKGIKVIDSDFLLYNGLEQFDLIVANFPFSDGEKHLHKAIDILFSGEIVCLLNAETLKNPYSNSRKDLVAKLNKLGAHVEYIQNAFSNAERKTDVEVALIYIEKIRDVETELFECMNEDLTEFESIEEKHEVATHNQIGNIVKRYNKDKEAVTNQIMDFYKNYKSLSKYLSLAVVGENIQQYNKQVEEEKGDLTEIMKKKLNYFSTLLKKTYWLETMKLDEVKKRLTSKKREELAKELDNFRHMDFTESNVRQLIINLLAKFPMMIDEAIDYLFEELTKHALRDTRWGSNEYAANIHYYNAWKTNTAFKINKKVIMPFYTGWSGIYSLSWEQEKFFDDMDLVMGYLDGGSTPKQKKIVSGEDVEEKSEPSTGKVVKYYLQDLKITRDIDTKYFKVSVFKKGTMHITFKDEDLLRRFNIHVGKKRNFLPMDYSNKPYEDLTPAEKEMVKEFDGGEKSYKTIERHLVLNHFSEQLLLGA